MARSQSTEGSLIQLHLYRPQNVGHKLIREGVVLAIPRYLVVWQNADENPPRTFPNLVIVKTTIYFANAFFPKVETASLGAPLLDFFDSKKIGRTDFTRKRVYFF